MANELDAAEEAGQRAWISACSRSLATLHLMQSRLTSFACLESWAHAVWQGRRHARSVKLRWPDLPALPQHDRCALLRSQVRPCEVLHGTLIDPSPRSHVDEFEIAYPDYNDRRAETANGIAYISGALTPTSGNPVFRVYDIDPDTYEVMDFVPHYTNRSEAAFQVDPVWKPYYSARESYGSYLDPPHPANASLNATFWHRVTEVFERNQCVLHDLVCLPAC